MAERNMGSGLSMAAIASSFDPELAALCGRMKAEACMAENPDAEPELLKTGFVSSEPKLHEAISAAFLTGIRKALAGERNDGDDEEEAYDPGQQLHMARKIAREAMILLKNDENLLPVRGNRKIAMIGEFAGEKSFLFHSTGNEVLSAMEAVRSVAPVTFARGFKGPEMTEEMRTEAARTAAEADLAILFLGFPEGETVCGENRTPVPLPACQEELLEAVLKVQNRVCIVLQNDIPIQMPWLDRVTAVLETWRAGRAGGGAVVDLLFGAVSPCGRLPEDYLNASDRSVLFPFGYGMSYTAFAWTDPVFSAGSVCEGDVLKAELVVTNTGSLPAKEVIQVYLRPDESRLPVRTRRILQDFRKVFLMPEESARVIFTLPASVFARCLSNMPVETDSCILELASSVEDVRMSTKVRVENR